MVHLPCPKCGSDDTVGTFCAACLRNLYPLLKNVKDAKIVFCVECKRVKHRGRWQQLDAPVGSTLQYAIVPGDDAELSSVTAKDIEFEMKPGIKKTITVPVTVTGKHVEATKEYDEEYEIPIAYEVTICPNCKKQSESYFEGVLQIRNETEEAKKTIYEYAKKHGKKGVHITKVVPTEHGTDYYMSDHRAIGHLAQQLKKEFHGELKINAQHFSEDKQAGKILYRTTAFLELPEYHKGDVIKRDDKYFLVLGIGQKVKVEELGKGGEQHFTYHRGESTLLQKATTTVSCLDPLEVLHPDTFQPVTPVRSMFASAELDVNGKVTVSYDDQNIFLIP